MENLIKNIKKKPTLDPSVILLVIIDNKANFRDIQDLCHQEHQEETHFGKLLSPLA